MDRPAKLCLIKSLYFLVMLLLSSSAQDESQLRFLVVVFNSGLRSPLSTYPNDQFKESAWPQGFGQLTQKGIEAQYKLGQFLRQRYSGYLNQTYVAQEIYVQSLDTDRSLMSASSLLAGLYPPVDEWILDILWQPIPVHTMPADHDPFLAACPALDVLWNETLHSPEIQSYFEQKKTFKVTVEALIGTNVSNVFDLEYVFDAVTCEKEQDMTVPEWALNLSSVFLDEIYPFYQMIYHNRTEAKRLISGQLVNEIVKFFNLRQQNLLNPQLKAYFLSADDRLIRSLLSGLDVYNFAMIPFSTAVMLELKYNNDLGYFVNIHLKNSTQDPFLLTMPDCDSNCPLDAFFNLTKDIIPDNWNMECYQFHSVTFAKIARSMLITTVSVACVLVILICICAVCCRKKFRKRVPRKYAVMRPERTNAFPEEMPMMNASAASSDLED